MSWVCPESGSMIRDVGDGGRCESHFHLYRESGEGYAASAWHADPGAENGTVSGFSTLYSPINRRVESRETFPSREAPKRAVSLPARPDDFSLLSLGKLRTLADPPQEWSVDGLLLRDGTSYVGSKPKVGKTVTAVNLAASIASGGPFLGRRAVAGTVVVLALEERRAKVKGLLCSLLGDAAPDLDERILVHVGAAPRDPYGALARLVDRHSPALLIVDTVAKLCRFSDINDYSEVVEKLEPISEMARSAHCHIALLGHLGKAERTDGTDEVLGSTALTAAVDTIVVLKRSTDGARTIMTIQRDGDDLPESHLEYDSTSGRCWLGSSRDEYKRLTIRAEIVALLSADGIQSEVQIREHTAHAANDVARALRDLVAEGSVTRYGSGRRGDPYRYGLRSAEVQTDD